MKVSPIFCKVGGLLTTIQKNDLIKRGFLKISQNYSQQYSEEHVFYETIRPLSQYNQKN